MKFTFTAKSETMQNLLKTISRIGPSSARVLITGESGVGKEEVAKTIHDVSNRAKKPFVSINCAALRETLLESELFGHEKGAFTGAYNRKIGLAEVANGGTLLLKDVDDLPPGLQAKLTRFLREGEIYRLGGKDPIKVDVRILTSTRKSLDAEVVKGNFREDLYYLLNTIVLNVPSLRKRREDIVLLANERLSNSTLNNMIKNRVIGESTKSFSPESIKLLERYDWPGNVRELHNLCDRLMVLVDDRIIEPRDLPKNIVDNQPDFREESYDPTLTLHEMEKRTILKALKYFDGNRTQAANALGITIKTLYNKLHEYDMLEQFKV